MKKLNVFIFLILFGCETLTQDEIMVVDHNIIVDEGKDQDLILKFDSNGEARVNVSEFGQEDIQMKIFNQLMKMNLKNEKLNGSFNNLESFEYSIDEKDGLLSVKLKKIDGIESRFNVKSNAVN